MSNSYGESFKITIFGQSHADAIGVVIEGIPAGVTLDTALIAQTMARRAPGNAPYATARKEPDLPEIVSGVVNGVTCGAPLLFPEEAAAEDHRADQVDGDDRNVDPVPHHACPSPGPLSSSVQICCSFFTE